MRKHNLGTIVLPLSHLTKGLLIFISLSVGHTFAQTSSNRAGVLLTATLPESITIIVAPSAVAFALDHGNTDNNPNAVSITTTWVLGTTRSKLKVYASFDSATSALNDGNGNSIPSVNVFGRVATGLPTTYTAFTQASPFGAAGAGLQLYSQTINRTNFTGTRTDTLNVRIDVTNLPLPTGVYVGTLHIQAQAL